MAMVGPYLGHMTTTQQAQPIPGVQVADVPHLTTHALVNNYADLRVWFAVNETDRRHPQGQRVHARLCAVVDELRRRGVLHQ